MKEKFVDLTLFNKQYRLPIEYSDTMDDGMIEPANQVLQQFKLNLQKIAETKDDAKLKEFISTIEKAKKELKKYANDKADDIGAKKKDNVFDTITPGMLLVHCDDDNNIEFAILCSLTYDIEHGVAIIFNNQKFIKVGSQDEVVWW
jgi:hypothetical protein